MSRAAALLALLVALLVAAGCGGDSERAAGTAAAPTTGSVPDDGWAGARLGNPKPVPDFTLTDQDGMRVTLGDLRGKVVLVTFLYTHCPDICPLIAANLDAAVRELEPAQRQDVRILAVSVDPKRDTRAQVRSYVKVHRLLPQFRYLIGTKRELTAVWRKFDVQAVARDPELVDHTAYTLLIDRAGDGIVIYPSDFTTQDVLHDLRRVFAS